MKHVLTIRLSPDALTHLDAYAQARGLSRTGMLELMIRLFAHEQRQAIDVQWARDHHDTESAHDDSTPTQE